MKNTIHIAYSTDEKYLPHVAVSMLSIIENSDNASLCFHIIYKDLKSIHKETILSFVSSYNNCEVYMYDSKKIDSILEKLHVSSSMPTSAYYRIFLGSILPESISKIIYLDGDTIAKSNINKLWHYLIKPHNIIAGVLDNCKPNAKENIGLSPDSAYINSGVLLIDLSRWRDSKIEDKCISYILKCNGEVYHEDQGVINNVLSDKIEILPPEYNLISSAFEMSVRDMERLNSKSNYYVQSEINYAIEHPVIIHFTPSFSNRPWQKNCSHPHCVSYRLLREKTPWLLHRLEEDKRSFKTRVVSFLARHSGAILIILIQKLIKNV